MNVYQLLKIFFTQPKRRSFGSNKIPYSNLALLLLFILLSVFSFTKSVEGATENTIFLLDFNSATDDGPITSTDHSITNTWIPSLYKQNIINYVGSTADGVSYELQRGLFNKPLNDKSLAIKGFDATKAIRLDFSIESVNPSYANIAALDCSDGGSFSLSFDFATDNFSVPLGISVGRSILHNGSELIEDQATYTQQIFTLLASGDIKIFNDTISAADIERVLGQPLKQNTWYNIEIFFNSTKQMGARINGQVVRQMSDMKFNGAQPQSIRGISNGFRIYCSWAGSVGITDDQAKETARYLDNIAYKKSDTAVTQLSEQYRLEIDFSGYNANHQLSGADRTITPTIMSLYGVDRVEYSVNGKFADSLSNAPYSLDLNPYGVGKFYIIATVYDANQRSASADITVTISAAVSAVQWKEPFDNGISGLPSYIVVGDQRGYVEGRQVDTSYGKSLIIGMGEQPNDIPGAGAIANFTNAYPTRHTTLEFEFYVVQAPSDSDRYRIALKQSGSTEIVIATIGSAVNNGGASASYTVNTWHKVAIDLDFEKLSCTIFFDQTQLGEPIVISNMTSMDIYRIYGPTNTGPSAIAVDNVTLWLNKLYNIDKVEGNSPRNDQLIDYTTDTLNVYLTGEINGASVVAKDVQLDSDYGAVEVSATTYDPSTKCIRLILGESLLQNSVYTLKIPPTVQSDTGENLGESLNFTFTTSPAEIYPCNIEYVGGKIYMDAVNSSDTQTKMYLVATTWRQNEYHGMTVMEINVEAKGTVTDIIVTPNDAQIGDAIRFMVWDNLKTPSLLANKVYQFSV